MRIYPINHSYYESYKADINSFYKNLKGTNFKLSIEKLKELKETSKSNYVYFTNNVLSTPQIQRYTRIMNNLKTNPKKFNITNEGEKFILFMFSVDPSFEAAKIYGECNHKDQVKEKMIKHFSFYDSKLIIIENFFIKNFLSEKKRNEINEEIKKRVYK